MRWISLFSALFIPAMLNFLIIPLVGAVDVFWVGRLEDAVSLAAQGAANQVFQSAFWIISFIPSVVAPVVAKAAAGGNKEELSKKIGEGIFCAAVVGAMGMIFMYTMRERCLGSRRRCGWQLDGGASGAICWFPCADVHSCNCLHGWFRRIPRHA